MNRQTLLAELAALEGRLQDPTLTDSDRQPLDQAWEETMDRLDELDELSIIIPVADWRDARVVIEEDRTPTPPPDSPVRFAPSPPVPRTVSSHGPPPLSSTHLLGLHPLSIDIPEGYAETACPPPPRGWEPDDEEIARWNRLEDDRVGCFRCPGCHYCAGHGYDGADEV